jgi:hypothetical protein
MSATFLHPVYEKVRELGLPYQIKETGGSVIIKITSTSQYQNFQQTKEKFRFQTTRTFDGSSNPNWRAPQTYIVFKTDFPDINFFRRTPPPQCKPSPPPPPPPGYTTPPPPRDRATPSPPPRDTSPPSTPPASAAFPIDPHHASDLSSASNRESPSELPPALKYLSTRTPLNPFRSSRRQILFPRTPNLLNPSSTSSQIALDLDPLADGNQAGIEAFKNVMIAVFAKKHF